MDGLANGAFPTLSAAGSALRYGAVPFAQPAVHSGGDLAKLARFANRHEEEAPWITRVNSAIHPGI